MRVGKKILLSFVIGLIALLVIVPLALTLIDWNFAKPWIADHVSAATGRSFAINGDLSMSWQRPGASQSGWRRLVPWPHLRAHNLVLGNPPGAATGPTMASVPQVDFTLNPLPLLHKSITISSLVLTDAKLNLEVTENGDNNWTFKKEKTKTPSPSPWRLDLQNLALNNGVVRLVDPAKKADVTTHISTLQDGTVTWNMQGKLNGDPLSGHGKAGSLLSMQDTKVKYPVEAELVAGETHITAKGTLTDPQHMSGLDIQLKILGASMSQLFPLSGIVLPETPKFSTEGRVVGTVAPHNLRLRYEHFTGKVGSSDIGGTLEYISREPRPILQGEVESKLLDIDDLRSLLGNETDVAKKKQPPDKILPVSPFHTERWDKIDADVKFTGHKIVHAEKLPLDNFFTKVTLNNGTLALQPLNFGIAGGRFTTEMTIEGKSKPPKARMKIAARGLKLSGLFPQVEQMHASLGEVQGNVELTAVGDSLAALAATANGEAKAFVSEGTISKLILEAMGLNIGSLVVTEIFGDKQVQLNCLASDFQVTNGLVKPRTFVVDTADATIDVDGTVDLGKEAFDLTIHPQSKGVRLLSLRSPIYVRGTFKHPSVGIDKKGVGLKAGAAAALGTAVAPLAALLALINPGPDQESPCGKLLAQAQQKPVAPPPGKTAPPKPAPATPSKAK
jgi:hypothetical protein